MSSGAGLAAVSTASLEELSRALREGSAAWPPSRSGLLPYKLDIVDFAPELLKLEASSFACVLEMVLAERAARAVLQAELVWTGPEAVVSSARDTAVVLRDLFRSAQVSALVAGFRFDHGAELLEPLYSSMRDRGVRAKFFVDLESKGSPLSAEDVDRGIDLLLARNWPFGDPLPELYVDSRLFRGNARASLHAKCVVIDGDVSLVTSANFTDRGQSRNIEAGVLVRSASFGAALSAQWLGLVTSGALTRVRRPL